MNRRTTLSAISAALLLAGFAMPAGFAAAQSGKQIQGTWAPVSVVSTDASGKKSDTFGPNAKGQLVFLPNGRYSLTLTSASLPKFASNNRAQGTADENKAVVAGSIAHFGKYTVDEKGKTFTFHIDNATFANWNGTAQKRPFSVKGDELKYSVGAGSAGGTAELVWKRVK